MNTKQRMKQIDLEDKAKDLSVDELLTKFIELAKYDPFYFGGGEVDEEYFTEWDVYFKEIKKRMGVK